MQSSAKRSRTSSSWTTESEWNDAAKNTPPAPAPTAAEKDDISQRVYNLPIPFQKALPDEYERDDDNDKKDEKVAPRTLHPRQLLLPARKMILTIGITTHPYLSERRFHMTMNATPTMTKNRRRLCQGYSTHTRSSCRQGRL